MNQATEKPMKTQADELRTEIAALDKSIGWAKKQAENNPDEAELCGDYAKQLEKRKKTLQMRLEREEAKLVRPQPQSVKAGPFDI